MVSALRPGTAEQAGPSRSASYRAAREERLDRIAWGIYLPADAPAAWQGVGGMAVGEHLREAIMRCGQSPVSSATSADSSASTGRR